MIVRNEWLQADGLGGFASGTSLGIPSRRYHSLLTVAARPPLERLTLVNAVEATLHLDGRVIPLSSFRYESGVINPDATPLIKDFDSHRMPVWKMDLGGGAAVTHRIFVPHGQSAVFIDWCLEGQFNSARLFVRPLLSGRSMHSLHKANPHFSFEAFCTGDYVEWTPYPQDVPRISARSSGVYHHEPLWYYNFLYQIDLERGFPATEDLAAPGYFEFDLMDGPALLMFAMLDEEQRRRAQQGSFREVYGGTLAAQERRCRTFRSPLDLAADAYIVKRGAGKTIIAGYPWFSDWGRDSFIAMRGLCLATERFDDARDILVAWSSVVQHGMLPNRFPEKGESPDLNSVDAALWYIVAAYEYLQMAGKAGIKVAARDRKAILEAISAIIKGYRQGTLFHIGCDADGLLSAGESGCQLTWMDAKIGNWVVTPRIGKPVEIEALWLNALAIGSRLLEDDTLADLHSQGVSSFERRFWNRKGEWLYDVVDVNHQKNEGDLVVDLSFRPNQIFSVGGLPFAILKGNMAEKVVAAVEKYLYTPAGLRSLAPYEQRYVGKYEGNPFARDAAYHQGTVWAWLMGPFVEAWVRVHGGTAEAKVEARQRYLQPLLDELERAGTSHVFEIADGDWPHHWRGCPFQAWSLGEVLRLDRVVLA